MAWADFQVQGVLGGFKAIGGYIQQSRNAKSERAWQRYNNALTRMQNATNQNAITVNQGMAVERNVREQYALRVSTYKTQASAEVAAGAVGAEGNSVDLVMMDIQRNESRAQAALARDFEYAELGFQAQRDSSNMQTEMQIDYKQIPKPSLLNSLLDWGADTSIKYWDSKIK